MVVSTSSHGPAPKTTRFLLLLLALMIIKISLIGRVIFKKTVAHLTFWKVSPINIIDIFPKIIEMEVPSLDNYLTMRQLQLSSHKRLNRGKLCIQNWAEKTVVSAELWADEGQMKHALTRLQ